jgi:hypothetical protein
MAAALASETTGDPMRLARLAAIALALLAAPFTAETQQGGKVYRLCMLSGGKVPQGPVSLISEWPDTTAALRTLGYEEGRNFILEARFADGKLDRLPALDFASASRRPR